jgi:hypothetical protein
VNEGKTFRPGSNAFRDLPATVSRESGSAWPLMAQINLRFSHPNRSSRFAIRVRGLGSGIQTLICKLFVNSTPCASSKTSDRLVSFRLARVLFNLGTRWNEAPKTTETTLFQDRQGVDQSWLNFAMGENRSAATKAGKNRDLPQRSDKSMGARARLVFARSQKTLREEPPFIHPGANGTLCKHRD